MTRTQRHCESKSLEIPETHPSFVQSKCYVTAVTLRGASVGRQEHCRTCICSDTAVWSAQMQDTHTHTHTPPCFFRQSLCRSSRNVLAYSFAGEHMESGLNTLLSKTCYKECFSRIRSWTLQENQIFSYRSVGLAGTLRPPNVSLYFVTRCEPGTQQHALLECALLYERDGR